MTDIDFSTDETLSTESMVRNTLAGEMPTMPQPEDDVVTLPRGRFLNGKWERAFQVRELTGKDEEYLARKRDSMDYFDAVLSLGVTRVGDTDMQALNMAERESILSMLLAGERELLFLTIIRVTFGNERDLEYQCIECENKYTTTLLLDHDFPLVDDLGENPPTSYRFTTSKGDDIDYRLVTGADQRSATANKTATLAEQNSAILHNVIQLVNGDYPVDKEAYVLGLSMRDRRDLVDALDKHQPKIDNELDLDCSACGTTNKVFLNWGDLFRP